MLLLVWTAYLGYFFSFNITPPVHYRCTMPFWSPACLYKGCRAVIGRDCWSPPDMLEAVKTVRTDRVGKGRLGADFTLLKNDAELLWKRRCLTVPPDVIVLSFCSLRVWHPPPVLSAQSWCVSRDGLSNDWPLYGKKLFNHQRLNLAESLTTRVRICEWIVPVLSWCLKYVSDWRCFKCGRYAADERYRGIK